MRILYTSRRRRVAVAAFQGSALGAPGWVRAQQRSGETACEDGRGGLAGGAGRDQVAGPDHCERAVGTQDYPLTEAVQRRVPVHAPATGVEPHHGAQFAARAVHAASELLQDLGDGLHELMGQGLRMVAHRLAVGSRSGGEGVGAAHPQRLRLIRLQPTVRLGAAAHRAEPVSAVVGGGPHHLGAVGSVLGMVAQGREAVPNKALGRAALALLCSSAIVCAAADPAPPDGTSPATREATASSQGVDFNLVLPVKSTAFIKSGDGAVKGFVVHRDGDLRLTTGSGHEIEAPTPEQQVVLAHFRDENPVWTVRDKPPELGQGTRVLAIGHGATIGDRTASVYRPMMSGSPREDGSLVYGVTGLEVVEGVPTVTLGRCELEPQPILRQSRAVTVDGQELGMETQHTPPRIRGQDAFMPGVVDEAIRLLRGHMPEWGLYSVGPDGTAGALLCAGVLDGATGRVVYAFGDGQPAGAKRERFVSDGNGRLAPTDAAVSHSILGTDTNGAAPRPWVRAIALVVLVAACAVCVPLLLAEAKAARRRRATGSPVLPVDPRGETDQHPPGGAVAQDEHDGQAARTGHSTSPDCPSGTRQASRVLDAGDRAALNEAISRLECGDLAGAAVALSQGTAEVLQSHARSLRNHTRTIASVRKPSPSNPSYVDPDALTRKYLDNKLRLLRSLRRDCVAPSRL